MKIQYEPNLIAARLFRRLITGWLVAAAAEYLLLPAQLRPLTELSGLAQMSLLRLLTVTAVVFAVLTVLSRFMKERTERWLMVGSFGVLAAVSLGASFTWAYLVSCAVILAMMVMYALRGWNGGKSNRRPIPAEAKSWTALTAGGAIAFFLLVSIWTVCRIYSFSTPSFDFSIFAQMFHSMKTTLQPITTIERDGPLSHFAVHVSPIYYLMLPFYCLVPIPATLQVLQAAVLASAVIPLWKLGRLHRLSPALRALLCLVLLLYPAYAGGTSYDIHENAFLTPLLLWLFYAMDRKNGILTALFGVLVLLVKEDAAVYAAVAALYLLLRSLLKQDRWGLRAGSGLLAVAVGYFLLVTAYLASHGDGVMTYRYDNFIYDGSGSLLTVIKAVLLCPMKAVFECVDTEKLKFIALTLLPLGLLPLLTRRYERFVLLIPYVLVNLMSDYRYQHDVFFQYTYGSTACLMYMTLVNLADIRPESRRVAAAFTALCIGALCFGGKVLPVALKYPIYCAAYDGFYDNLRQTLEAVPEGASVAATTFYTTHLSQRDVLYDVRYASKEHLLSCEYVVLDPDDQKSYRAYGGYEGLLKMLTAEGYQKTGEYDDDMVIFRKMGT